MTDFLFDLIRPSAARGRVCRFTCMICGKPGYGAWNTKVHRGDCLRKYKRDTAAKAYAQQKKRRQAARKTQA